MAASLLLDERIVVGDDAFVELKVWRVAEPLPGCAHLFKYRLAYVVGGECVLRYDNEAGKGDHRHAGGRETAYRFTSLRRLQADFWADVARKEK